MRDRHRELLRPFSHDRKCINGRSEIPAGRGSLGALLWRSWRGDATQLASDAREPIADGLQQSGNSAFRQVVNDENFLVGGKAKVDRENGKGSQHQDAFFSARTG